MNKIPTSHINDRRILFSLENIKKVSVILNKSNLIDNMSI